MKSNTKISKQLKKKANNQLVETVLSSRKQKSETWKKIASILAGSRKNYSSLNLSEIEKQSKEGDIILVPGKILSQGEISKKIKIVALGFSTKAKEKLLNARCEAELIHNEIKSNPNAKGIKILK